MKIKYFPYDDKYKNVKCYLGRLSSYIKRKAQLFNQNKTFKKRKEMVMAKRSGLQLPEMINFGCFGKMNLHIYIPNLSLLLLQHLQ